MPSPFKQLLEESLPYDEWGGAFSCDEPGCHSAAAVARYYYGERRLVWECQAAGHENVLENVNP